MIRKLILGAVAAVAIGFGGQAASAHEPQRGPVGGPVGGPGRGGYIPPQHGHQHHDHDYVVFVRHNGHWDRYGRFETRREAERVALRLEDRGQRVRVEVVESRRW